MNVIKGISLFVMVLLLVTIIIVHLSDKNKKNSKSYIILGIMAVFPFVYIIMN